MTLVKADLGTKRICPSCSARFYDLQKRPIECPKCAFTFEPEALYKQRRPRQPEAEKVPERARGEEEELQESEEIAEDAEAATGDEATVIEPDEDEEDIVAEEEETVSAGMTVVDPVAQRADLDVEEEEIVEEDVEDPALLEEVGEEDDVSGIIDTDIEKDER
jgi:uncharacterized protein (TIGR02300 family)